MKNKILVTFLFVLFATVIFVQRSQAQMVLPLTVAPARQELSLNPGDETAAEISFFNRSDVPLTGIIKKADFIVQGKEGAVELIEDPNQIFPKYTASAWLTLPYDRASIPANDKVTFQAKIKVPFDAKPGGRYVSVYFEPNFGAENTNNQKAAGSSVSPRLAALIYIKVSGNAFEKAILSRFFAPSFFEYGPIKIQTEILNRGDYHVRPKGVITAMDTFGGVVDQVPLKEFNVFPDASRSYVNELGTKWMFGRYKINIAASYGDRGQVLTSFIYVWVFPWKAALIIVLAIIIVFILLRSLYKTLINKETNLEQEIQKEKEEIEKLKAELKKRKE
ncbi:hypothetical protein GYA28_03785 [Candidatus Roizmanbacteria bacterium]|jgi:hypothetical protein|nr:hypothetical protein [Candidatus Roizmanbacteria bacterium]